MLTPPPAPLKLMIDALSLKNNWRWLAVQSGGAQCGAVVKADGYGLGAVEVVRHLLSAGCRTFFVATWAEAISLKPHVGEASLCVLNGVRDEDMPVALALGARPVLNSPEQIARWRQGGGGTCDIMIDTGMNRLGIDPNVISADMFEGLDVEVAMSHLACADQDHLLNTVQPMLFSQFARKVKARRLSLANSAGVMLGEKYHFDLTRPGLSIYGGVPRMEAEGYVAQVVRLRAQILQRRTVRGGESVGYGATWMADRQRETAVIHIGYADGYLRGFSDRGSVRSDDGTVFPVIGLVSMDMAAVDVSDKPSLGEGDWLEIDFDLSLASMTTGISQYELLTSLGDRFDRHWT